MRLLLTLISFLFGSLLLGFYDISNASDRGVDLALNEHLLAPANQQGLHWEELKKENCVGQGKRQYGAHLIGSDKPANWERDCWATSIDIGGKQYNARACVGSMFGMWGQFDVPDASCPMSYWDPFKPDRCTGTGVRQYSAILRVLPENASWEDECAKTGATILGQEFAKPTRCVKEMFGLIAKNMWGEFDVKDDSCMPKWDTFKADQCVAVGIRQYSAQLLVPVGLAWETCSGIGAYIQGQVFDKPDRCKNEGLGGMWGEFDVKDESCLAKWDTFKADQCVAVGVRQYSSQLIVPDGLSWEVSCETIAASIQRQAFTKPDRCKNEGLGGMWGEFDVKDDSCLPAWNPFKEDQCVNLDKRQYSAQLIVPAGLSWEVSCVATGASIESQVVAKPDRCKNMGLAGMWGEFDVTDTTCRPRWGEFKRDRCTGTRTRQYSAILWDIPPTLSWERTCQLTAATVAGQDFSKPGRCVNVNLNIWGEFDVTDRICAIEYPLTHMAWQTIVAIVVVLLVVVGLVVLRARFLLLKKILNAMHKDEG